MIAVHVLRLRSGIEIRTPCVVVEAYEPRHAEPGARVRVRWPSGREGSPRADFVVIRKA